MAGNNSNEVYDYLTQNYDKVTIENGYYHVVNNSGYKCEGYIPVTYSSGDAISVYTFTPGQGNSGIDAVKNITRGDSHPDCAIFIASDYRLENSNHNVIEQAATFANDNGMVIANLGAESFSAGGGVMLESVAQFVSDPNNSTTQVTVVMTEGYTGSVGQGHNWDYQMDKSVYGILKNNGITVYGVSSTQANNKHGRNSIENYERIARHGVDVVFIDTNEIGHGEKMTESIDNGMTFYLMGLSDELGNTCPHGNSDYRTRIFVDGKWVRSGDISDYAGVDNRIFLTDEILNIEEYNKLYGYGKGNGSMTITKIPVPDKYEHLKNLEHLSINLGSSNISDSVVSNLNYIVDSINAIRDQIKQSGFMQGFSKPTFSSSSGIPGCLSGYIDAYYNIMYDLMDRVEEQTEAIISYGQAYVDMDLDLSNRAEELASGTITGGIIESPSRFAEPSESPTPTLDEVNVDTPQTGAPNNQNQFAGTPNGGGMNNPNGNQNSTPSNPNDNSNSLAKEDNHSSQNGSTDNDNVINSGQVEENTPEGASLIEMERTDGSRIVAVMDGENVNELKYVYEYDNSNIAENNYDAINNKYKNDILIEEVKVNDNKVEAIFKKSTYVDMTMDMILEKYFIE